MRTKCGDVIDFLAVAVYSADQFELITSFFPSLTPFAPLTKRPQVVEAQGAIGAKVR